MSRCVSRNNARNDSMSTMSPDPRKLLLCPKNSILETPSSKPGTSNEKPFPASLRFCVSFYAENHLPYLRAPSLGTGGGTHRSAVSQHSSCSRRHPGRQNSLNVRKLWHISYGILVMASGSTKQPKCTHALMWTRAGAHLHMHSCTCGLL